jgi:hypothetical protein
MRCIALLLAPCVDHHSQPRCACLGLAARCIVVAACRLTNGQLYSAGPSRAVVCVLLQGFALPQVAARSGDEARLWAPAFHSAAPGMAAGTS